MPFSLIDELSDPHNFPVISKIVERGDTGDDAFRLQRRLNSLHYLFYRGVDGKVGNGTVEAITNFQRVNGLPQSGIADAETLERLYSSNAIENDQPIHPYLIRVSRKRQRVEVYAWNETADDYNIPHKSFICSTGARGTETPKGTYWQDTGPMNRWHKFTQFNCYAQYSYTIQGNILFHSVLYSKPDERTLQRTSVRNLGKAVSHGCVRLKVNDAKWIYDNCPAGTTVIVE